MNKCQKKRISEENETLAKLKYLVFGPALKEYFLHMEGARAVKWSYRAILRLSKVKKAKVFCDYKNVQSVLKIANRKGALQNITMEVKKFCDVVNAEILNSLFDQYINNTSFQ